MQKYEKNNGTNTAVIPLNLTHTHTNYMATIRHYVILCDFSLNHQNSWKTKPPNQYVEYDA